MSGGYKINTENYNLENAFPGEKPEDLNWETKYYEGWLPTSYSSMQQKLPGVLNENPSIPYPCYVIQKGSGLLMLDYSAAHLKSLQQRLGSWHRDRKEATRGQGIGTRLLLNAGFILDYIKIHIARTLLLPVSATVRYAHIFLPRWLIKGTFTFFALLGIVVSRVFLAALLFVLAYNVIYGEFVGVIVDVRYIANALLKAVL